MGYKTIINTGYFEYEIKKSLFIGNAKRVETEQGAKDFIENISRKYKDARHNCYAFSIGEKKNVQRYSDDSEPKGTAGIPMLEILNKKDITNLVVVVTRYFGGILLGSSGLYRAYSKAAGDAIDNGIIGEVVQGSLLSITVPYKLADKLSYFLEMENYFVEDKIYTDVVVFKIYIQVEKIDFFRNTIISQTNNSVEIKTNIPIPLFKNKNKLFNPNSS